MIKMNEVQKAVDFYNKKEKHPIDAPIFIRHAQRYIKASKEHRLMCHIERVSSSGMSRTMRFFEMMKSEKNQHGILNFWTMFRALQHMPAKNSDGFLIGGCGMDMVFATHYNVIHELKNMGFISEKECKVLSQKTPHKI